MGIDRRIPQPKAAQIQNVADIFKAACERFEREDRHRLKVVDMAESFVVTEKFIEPILVEDRDEPITCETKACHVGWYYILRNEDSMLDDWKSWSKTQMPRTYAALKDDGTTELAHYSNGASMLAEDLGFDDYSDMLDWAAQYPETWGNHYGARMLGSDYIDASDEDLHGYVEEGICNLCFGVDPGEEVTLWDIYQQWQGAADRRKAQEMREIKP